MRSSPVLPRFFSRVLAPAVSLLDWRLPQKRRALLTGVAMTLASLAVPASAAPTVSVGVLKFGTVNWELSTMQQQKFDQQQGFELAIKPMAGMSATRTAFKSGAVDVIVADWMWATRQRDEGDKLQFIPYSSSVGKVMLGEGVVAQTLADLKDKKIGIVGGPVSKGWLLLRALGLQQGIDLKAQTEQVYGAPPLLSESLKNGQIDALVTFWHFAAKLEGEGYRAMTDLQGVGRELGMQSDLPMLGYVFRESWAQQHPELVAGLQQASVATKAYLKADKGAWQQLRPSMKASNDAVFERLREGFLAGIPESISAAQVNDAGKMFTLLAELGGAKLVGSSRELDPLTFWVSAN